MFTDKTNPDKYYAIKITHLAEEDIYGDDVSFEAKIFKRMEKKEGFLKLYDFGKYEHYMYLVTELQGPSVSYLLRLCKGVFSLKTSLMLFDQMISRVYTLHESGIIHSRLSPDRFIIGLTPNDTTLYLTSFKEARIYSAKQERKISDMDVDFDFMSCKKHEKKDLNWKDDLESLCYILVYLLKGELPWSPVIKESFDNIKNGDSTDLLSKKVLKMKKEINVEELCVGLPGKLKRTYF